MYTYRNPTPPSIPSFNVTSSQHPLSCCPWRWSPIQNFYRSLFIPHSPSINFVIPHVTLFFPSVLSLTFNVAKKKARLKCFVHLGSNWGLSWAGSVGIERWRGVWEVVRRHGADGRVGNCPGPTISVLSQGFLISQHALLSLHTHTTQHLKRHRSLWGVLYFFTLKLLLISDM